ncbi:hypothetical protein [Caballeronia zhejiangensis]|uniref:hypothetical protein n=1 Tax=Caballeronia zhejiangensis TaxID=871203 RepID=UPI00158DD0C4|nr:hypothetical protein [Caballeronia zhejiangensis]MCG7403034.1 hypothetical protein [Caballeronia zhejiangensis]MCI1043858.1 hypothetical protein [Caballeronia zhejiangensis]
MGAQLHSYPSVSAIEIASLHPGDLLAVHLPTHANRDHAEHIRDLLIDRLPSAVNCAVMMGDDVRLEVVRVVNPAYRPFQRPIGGFAAGCSTTGLTVVLEQ